MSRQAHSTESRHDCGSGQSGELAKGGDAKPAKGGGETLVENLYVEGAKERGVIVHDAPGLLDCGGFGGLLGSERPGSNPEAKPRSGDGLDLDRHSFDERRLATEVSNSAVHGSQEQTRYENFDFWYQ